MLNIWSQICFVGGFAKGFLLYLVKFLFAERNHCLLKVGKVDLVSLSPEGRIVLTLRHGKHTYSELRFETGLSDRWLTVKLEELERGGVVEKNGRWYGLGGKLAISAYELSLYMSFQARRMAAELAKLQFVRAIILFGSVAQNYAHEYSDLDMIVVVSGSVDEVKREVVSEISRLESKHHMTVEPLILAEEDFLDNVRSREGGVVYGVADGYEVLVDKTGEFAEILRDRVEEIKRTHVYLEDARIWLKAK